MDSSSVDKTILVWDEIGLPSESNFSVILWRGIDEILGKNVVAASLLVEEYSDLVKSRYLAWVYDFGKLKIDGIPLTEVLEIAPGISYWWLTLIAEKCNYAFSPNINDALRLIAFDIWASNFNFDKLLLATSNLPLAECFELWCLSRGLKFELIKSPNKSKLNAQSKQFYWLLPSPLLAALKLIYHYVTRWPLRGIGVREWVNSPATLSFFSYMLNLDSKAYNSGKYKSSYWADIPERLSRSGVKSNWLHLYVNGGASSIFNTAKAIKRFNNDKSSNQLHVTLDSFLTISICIKVFIDWIYLRIKANNLKKIASSIYSDGLFLWPLMSKEWQESLSGPRAISCLLTFRLFEDALRRVPTQSLGIYLHEQQHWEISLISNWRAMGHKYIVGVQHSTVFYWDMRSFNDPRSYERTMNYDLPLPDKLAVNGPISWELFLQSGYPCSRLQKVEALRYIYLSKYDNFSAVSNPSELENTLNILILGDYLPINNVRLIALVKGLVNQLSNKVNITLKSHPASRIKSKELLGIHYQVNDGPIEDLIKRCDIVLAGASTSAAVEAYCCGIPVITVLDQSTLNFSPLRGFKDVFFCSSSEELIVSLNNAKFMLKDKMMPNQFFWLDPKIPKWAELFKLYNNNLNVLA